MIEAELPDGTVLEFPEGTAPDVVQRVVKQHLKIEAPKEQKSAVAAPFAGFSKGVGNVMFGGQELLGKGLSAIGANSAGDFLIKDAAQRKAAEEAAIAPYKEQHPMLTGGGELGGEILSTLPVGGGLAKVLGAGVNAAKYSAPAFDALARGAQGAANVSQGIKYLSPVAEAVSKGASAVASGVSGGKYAAPLIEALRTGGMSAGAQTGYKALASRALGGALTGGATGALTTGDMEGAQTGALIGGALPVAGKLIQGAGTLAKKAIGGTTGVGEEALAQALKAGRQGGKAAEDFTAAMRGNSNPEDVLTMAKQNLEAMAQQKQAAYRQGMAGVKADKTILDLKNVDQAVSDALGMATFKGQIKNEKAAQALSQIKGEIDNWKSLDPAEFHTPEGLDALKQKVGGILEGIPYEQKTARTAAGNVYNSIKSEISKQAPEYSKVMKGYSEATDTIKEIERALSQGQKASADTGMRKLQSLMRNNVNTNYGQRQKLAETLINSGGQDFMPALAGQALNDAMPRGMQRFGVGSGGAVLAATGNIPAAAALGAMSSPRLMGEAFYGAGKLGNLADTYVNPALIEALKRGTYAAAPIAGQQ